ncbi:hypothetical protein Sjap_020730 [Stephania japonica]|uniref:Staygreen protein domain-containing protein n=1 Tax=Stephania japonica TaxID=461633 RepID=A0AAP0F188_9MAGN
MASTANLVLPTQLRPSSPFPEPQRTSFFIKKKRTSVSPVSRLFGPAIFEASKLKVLFLGIDEKRDHGKLPRTYTLTHSDITAKLTLAVSQTINGSQLQGWYNRLYRDEVVAEWKKVKDKMSLHVHCHISGGHFMLDLCAKLRFYIFSKELPVVLKAFVHGDGNLFQRYPELEEALVWVYFHSSIPEFNRAECWGPLKDAAAPSDRHHDEVGEVIRKRLDGNHRWGIPKPCEGQCGCCFPQDSVIPWSQDLGDQMKPKQGQALQR